MSLDGQETRLSDFKGKAVLLNHWAIWCGPCIREMPSILSLSEKTKTQNIAVVPLSMDRSGAKKVTSFVERKKWPTEAFYIDQKMKIALGSAITGIPATQILNKNGQEVARLVGTYEWDSDEVSDLMACLAQ